MKVNPGEEVFIGNPPSAGKPMSERTADETITKLTRKLGAAHKVLKVDNTSVTVDRDGVEDKVSKDRVTRAPARLDPDTLRLQATDVQEQEKQSTKNSAQPPPRRSERHSSKQPKTTVQNSEKEYTVEKVVDFQDNAYIGDYKVRWHRFGPEHDLWLPAEEVPQHFRAAYHRRRDKSPEQQERGQKGTARRGRRAERGRK